MEKYSMATFAGGCFWCTEAVFKRVEGVVQVESGYSGGEEENPTYKQVSSKKTGHAEAIQITFDPEIISYKDLVEIFFKTHDPTTLNRQGNDVGAQYRSVIFYHDEKQKKTAEDVIETLENSGNYKGKIVTTIVPYKNFYKAESYHQDFYDSNPNYPYCIYIIDPKISKLKKDFGDKLKKN